MSATNVSNLNQTLHNTQTWLNDLVEIGRYHDESQAYSAFRAVLHSLRDRLTVDEATDLGAQLPMLVRGFYYEGWKPALAPNKERSRGAFLDSVAESLHGTPGIDPEHACRSVFHLLKQRVTGGEIDDVRDMLPEDMQPWWDELS